MRRPQGEPPRPATAPDGAGEDSLDRYVARRAEARARRQPRGMLASEKLRGPAEWSRTSQRDAMVLLEMQHCVAAYEAWPMGIPLGVGAEDVVTYHPAIGVTYQDGRRAVIDICTPDEEAAPWRQAFGRLLASAMADCGMSAILMAERGLRGDRRLPLARAAMRAAGWPVRPADEFSFVRMLAGWGRPVELRELPAPGGGRELQATACVLAMRRVLTIDLAAPALEECRVALPSTGRNV